MELVAALRTDIGLKRSQNQDSAISRPELGLFVVADGMGGHKGGETASAIAVEVIPDYVEIGEKKRKWEARQLLQDAISGANEAIYLRSQDEPALQGMGTTSTAVLFTPKLLTIGHVGDSRCYFFRNKMGWQLTRDHSLVQEKLRAGLITRDQVKTDQMKNVITRSVGFEPRVYVDLYEMPIQPGDLFMLCSDGLSGMMEDSALFEKINAGFDGNWADPQHIGKIADELIDAAKKGGGDDNITVILIYYAG